MLVSCEELRFDFKGAQFSMSSEKDCEVLSWVFSQFLYGEVTGIQCGHWLYHSPHFQAATFIAKQATEELSHVRRFLRIFSMLGTKPQAPHWVIRFLTTGMMGKNWGEHVAMEMALGEGLVLGIFYAMLDTIPDAEIKKILESSIAEEERHCEFGEAETQAWIAKYPSHRKVLLALAVVQSWAMRRLKGFCAAYFRRMGDHVVLGQLEAFFEHTIRGFELRVERMGICQGSIRDLSASEKLGLILMLPIRRFHHRISVRKRLLTDTYLNDPVIEAESRRFRT